MPWFWLLSDFVNTEAAVEKRDECANARFNSLLLAHQSRPVCVNVVQTGEFKSVRGVKMGGSSCTHSCRFPNRTRGSSFPLLSFSTLCKVAIAVSNSISLIGTLLTRSPSDRRHHRSKVCVDYSLEKTIRDAITAPACCDLGPGCQSTMFPSTTSR